MFVVIMTHSSCMSKCIGRNIFGGFQEYMVSYSTVTTVCSKKNDAKIEITITATNLIRIKYPLSNFNYHLSGANVENFNKVHCTVFEQQPFKKMKLKNRSFQYGKVALAVRTHYHQLQFVLKVVAICTDTCMSLVQTVRSLLLPDFLSADPVASICRRSRSSAQDQSLLGNSSNNFLKLLSVFRPL